MLAPRSARARQPALSYFAAFLEACDDLWDPATNPGGAIVLSVAENRLSQRSLLDALAAAPPPPEASLNYQDFRGIAPLRAALAGVLTRTLLRRRRRRRRPAGGRRRQEVRRPGDAPSQDGVGGDGAASETDGGGGQDGQDGDCGGGGEDDAARQQDERRQCRLLARDMWLACGAGSVVDLLFHLIAAPGDACLIPAPYYPAFDNDLAVRDGVCAVPAFLDLEDGVDRSACGLPSREGTGGAGDDRRETPPAAGERPASGPRHRASLSEQLEAAAAAWEAGAAARHEASNAPSSSSSPTRAAAARRPPPPPRVRALLLTNPSNPLGTVLRRGRLLEAARWAHERGVHLVCDEIYGAMVWGEGEEDDEDGNGGGDDKNDNDDDDPRFVSAWRLLSDGALGRQLARAGRTTAAAAQARAELLTHVIWGLSKDFCASGLRVGVLLTRNPGVGAAWGNLSYFAGVGFPLQHALAHALSDEAWVDDFCRENTAALRASWAALGAALDAAGIPRVRGARGAMFCWVDLREGLVPTAAVAAGAEGRATGAEGGASGGGGAGGGGGGGGAGGGGPAAAAPPRPSTQDRDWEAERALWRAFVAAKVVLTPGEACHAPEPGFFRVCWAWMPREALPVAVSRLRAVLDGRARLKRRDESG